MSLRRAFALALLSLLALPRLAAAHAVLLKTAPPARAVLREAPREVALFFNERLEPAYSTVTLSREEGAVLETGRASVSGQDARRLALPLPLLGPGSYVVRYRVLSVDGHLAEGRFGFVVRGP